MSRWRDFLRKASLNFWLRYPARATYRRIQRRDDSVVQPPLRSDVSSAHARLRELAALEPESAAAELESPASGLTEPEAVERLKRYGPNAIAHTEHAGIWRELWQRLCNPLNFLLIVLAVLSLFIGDRGSALIILFMVLLSVSLAFFQERRSNHAAEKLKAMVHTTATVLRNGVQRELPIAELVPGDRLHLSAGDMVPADVRLLAAKDLFLNQAALTGEALPVEKFPFAVFTPAVGTAQLDNICLMGTSVLSGTAMAVVIFTGTKAEFGTVANLMSGVRPSSDFDRGITRFSWLMIRFILIMAPLVFIINGLTKNDWLQALLFAAAVAVGLTPEMLPMIVTVNLGKGALAMARRRVIVKHLNAIQNAGAMDVLCTDKTGTLTQDRIILEKHVDLSGQDSQKVLDYAFLNSYYQSGLKSLLDIAVLQYTEIHEKLRPNSEYKKIDEIPFDFNRRRMSVVVEGGPARLLICKGAVEELFHACVAGEIGSTRFALDENHLRKLRTTSTALNEDGFRVVAVAYKEVPLGQQVFSTADESDLILLGYIAFLDPPKESALSAIAALNGHGVAVKILTGDNEVVARKVCHDVGLRLDCLALGDELETLPAPQLDERVEQAQLFARLSPQQKVMVIDALRRNGHVVGFLGDGINDGPALKAADVSFSVDTAVDIAKESADIILLEKDLCVLDEGVIEGRKVFGNIIKYIRMGASSNFGNMFSVLGASALLPFLPMAPLQVIFNNLLYDFSQTAIPTDNVDREYIERPRRWEIGNIARFMLLLGPISSVFDYFTYGMMYFLFHADSVARTALFQTGWFVESLLSQTLIIHIIRTRRMPFLESRASWPLIMTSLVICCIGVILPFSSFATALGFTPLPPLYWPLLLLILSMYLLFAYRMNAYFHARFEHS